LPSTWLLDCSCMRAASPSSAVAIGYWPVLADCAQPPTPSAGQRQRISGGVMEEPRPNKQRPTEARLLACCLTPSLGRQRDRARACRRRRHGQHPSQRGVALPPPCHCRRCRLPSAPAPAAGRLGRASARAFRTPPRLRISAAAAAVAVRHLPPRRVPRQKLFGTT
jgi:hypothetical protein